MHPTRTVLLSQSISALHERRECARWAIVEQPQHLPLALSLYMWTDLPSSLGMTTLFSWMYLQLGASNLYSAPWNDR